MYAHQHMHMHVLVLAHASSSCEQHVRALASCRAMRSRCSTLTSVLHALAAHRACLAPARLWPAGLPGRLACVLRLTNWWHAPAGGRPLKRRHLGLVACPCWWLAAKAEASRFGGMPLTVGGMPLTLLVAYVVADTGL